ANGLPTDRLQSIYEDARGVLWLGSKSGLIRIEDGRISVFDTSQGLQESVVCAVLDDGAGNLWLSGNRAIYRIPVTDLLPSPSARRVRVTAFGKSDGLGAVEGVGSVQPVAAKDARGRLYFPTVHGVAILDPERVLVGHLPPPVRIER